MIYHFKSKIMNLFESNIEPKLDAKIPEKEGYNYTYDKKLNLFFTTQLYVHL